MAEGGGQDWTQEYYPIAWLPYHVRKEIADFLDAGIGGRGFDMFASLLGFNPLEINNLRVCIAVLLQILSSVDQGPGVQSILSLTSSLRGQLLSVLQFFNQTH